MICMGWIPALWHGIKDVFLIKLEILRWKIATLV